MKHGDHAYIPGTGPDDKYCVDCGYFTTTAKHWGKCKKAAELRRTTVISLHSIRELTQACKYFVSP